MMVEHARYYRGFNALWEAFYSAVLAGNTDEIVRTGRPYVKLARRYNIECGAAQMFLAYLNAEPQLELCGK